VIIAEIGWITMGIVDTIIVGRSVPPRLAPSGRRSCFRRDSARHGHALRARMRRRPSFGAGRVDECHRWLFAGLQLALVLSVVLVGVGLAGVALLPRARMHPDVIVLLQPYLQALMWSAPPLMVYTVFRRYLQAMNIVGPVTVAVLAANVVNAVGNWIFVYGKLGAPALGVRRFGVRDARGAPVPRLACSR
jgi:MATE family multidrug resistance protein